MNQLSQSVDDKLCRWEAARISESAEMAQRLVNEIYGLVLRGQGFEDIWDECILRRLVRLFDCAPPKESVYGERVRELRARRDRVILINNFLYLAIDGQAVEAVIEAMRKLEPISESRAAHLRSGDLSGILRGRLATTSERMGKAVDVLTGLWGDEEPGWKAEAERCRSALKDREAVGCVSVLLVYQTAGEGLVSSVNAALQPGTGSSQTATPASPAFESAIDRARLALVSSRFLGPSMDAVLTGDLSDASYSGASVALGAAVAMYSCQNQLSVDPLTAFTGDIKLEESEWRVRGVDGIAPKLRAAAEAGFRTVLLPAENEADVPRELSDRLRVICVGTLTELILRLQLPAISAQAETLQLRKVRALEAGCAERGWQLGGPTPIQDGSQFTISPATPPELKVVIYMSGGHSPKDHKRGEFGQLLELLNLLDLREVPLRPINQVFTIKDQHLRERIASELGRLSPMENKTEQYCDYSLVFESPPERVSVKQYSSGKMTIQGRGGELYQRILEVVVPLYNVHHPNATLTVDEFLEIPASRPGPVASAASSRNEMPLPYMGTDESGKGDYFGPLVVAAVWLDEGGAKRLESLGVRDSKSLSDKRCRELAQAIRQEFRGSYHEVEILPERYNELYEEFKKEKKTLNHLLAWGHARALETLLERRDSKHAVADQFGDESYIRSKLMERGASLELLQTPKAERYMAVAAASVLARDRFLSRLQQLSREAGIDLPKGASPAVVDAAHGIVAKLGAEGLRRVAKLHFKTTGRVLDST